MKGNGKEERTERRAEERTQTGGGEWKQNDRKTKKQGKKVIKEQYVMEGKRTDERTERRIALKAYGQTRASLHKDS